MSSIYAIGDIHGRIDKLEALLQELSLRDGDRLVFVGDYVDRGPDPRGVVERLIDLGRTWPCTFLLGNHESMFLDYIGWEGPNYFAGDSFLPNGGLETLLSYGCIDLNEVEEDGLELPGEHMTFFRGLQLFHRDEGYVFVHAGLGPEELAAGSIDEALKNPKPENLLWRRTTGEIRHDLDVTLVYGHTVRGDYEVRWNLPYSIGIDTGAVYGGPLTAIRLPEETLIQV